MFLVYELVQHKYLFITIVKQMKKGKRFFQFELFAVFCRKKNNRSDLKTFKWDILNPDQLINLDINNKRRTSII